MQYASLALGYILIYWLRGNNIYIYTYIFMYIYMYIRTCMCVRVCVRVCDE